MPNKPTDPNKRGGEEAITMEGVRSSAAIRQELIESGDDVLLAFSTGKDSISAWLAMLDSGMPPERIHPYYLYAVPKPGLQFINDTLDYFEDFFQRRIVRYPHPSVYRFFYNFIFQPPQRRAVIEAARLPEIDYPDVTDAIQEDLGIGPGLWILDGVRATDSIIRRISIKRHGPMKFDSRKVSPIWDWRVQDVRNAMAFHNVKWPIDYEMFGRSWDGLDRRFTEPISRRFPEDYETLKFWFPLIEMELFRDELK